MGPSDRRVSAKPYGEQSIADVSRRVETTERDIDELNRQHDALLKRVNDDALESAVFREGAKPWLNVVKGLCYLLGASAIGALLKLVIK